MELLMSDRRIAARIPSLSFPTFRPHPLIHNGHLQTIAGAYLLGRIEKYRAVQHLVRLEDGDAIVLHEDEPAVPSAVARPRSTSSRAASRERWSGLPEPGEDAPIALLAHGLGGSHLSGYMQRTAAKLAARGVRVFRMDLRGCGSGFSHALQPVHAGRSDDVAAALAWIGERYPGQGVTVVGYSMGANMVLRMAGNFGSLPPANLASVMAVSPPIDLAHCSAQMQKGLNRHYDRRFVRALLAHTDRRRKEIPGALDRELLPRPQRIFDFDNRFTAPLCGFADVHDYYAQASSGPLLPRISVPTLIMTSEDDPIICVRMFAKASYSPSTQLVVTPGGGHLGFIGVGGIDADRRWLDWRAVDWVLASHSPHPRRAVKKAVHPVPR